MKVWGTVCDDEWGNVDVGVACRQLGHSQAREQEQYMLASAMVVVEYG